MGLPPAVIAGIIIVAAIALFFVKRTLDQRDKQKTEKRRTLSEYGRLQEEALFKAYRRLYEDVDIDRLSQTEFLRVISQTDEMIMAPFTRYRNDLSSDVLAKLYDIHNDLAQFKPDPNLPSKVTREAIHKLSAHRERFLQKIESVRDVLRRYR